MQTQTTAAATPEAPRLFTLQIPAVGAYWPEHGGQFGGIVFNDDGTPGHLIIVGPEVAIKVDHTHAIAFAAELEHNGFKDWQLPDRKQGPVLVANRAALDFKAALYWLKERHAEYYGYAWCQSFLTGTQYDLTRHLSLRARAVRTIAI